MNYSAKGKKQFVHVGCTSRCYNMGERQSIQPIITIPNNKSRIERINTNTVRRIK